jgi:transcriptional regulator with XRE-family HTH domain
VNMGDNVRRLAGMHLVQHEDLATLVGLSKQGLSNIVAGRSNPSSATAYKLGQAFAVPMDALFADTETCLRAGLDGFAEAPARKLARGRAGRQGGSDEIAPENVMDLYKEIGARPERRPKREQAD